MLIKFPGSNLILLGAYNANTLFDLHRDFGHFEFFLDKYIK